MWGVIDVGSETALGTAELERALSALSDPRAAGHVDAEVVVRLLDAIDFDRMGADVRGFGAKVIAHVELRWADLRGALAGRAIQTHERDRIFAAFPALKHDPI